MEEKDLFEVGQLVEARSFQPGYRGAWFNCKVLEKIISTKGNAVKLRYCDFPDEKLHFTKIYQKPQGRKRVDVKKELMLRPCFPPIYHESQLSNASAISGVAVVVKDVWCVGDLVDWRFDDCYWSGKISEVSGNGKYQIELLPQPFGEGAFYEGSSDQLRPSLEWSPKEDWKLSTPPPVLGWDDCRSPARLINLMKQERSVKTAHAVDSTKEVEGKSGAVLKTSHTVDNREKKVDEKSGAVLKTAHTVDKRKKEVDEKSGAVSMTARTVDNRKNEVVETSSAVSKAAHTVDNRKRKVEEKSDSVSQPKNLLPYSNSSGSLTASNGFSQMGKGPMASKETKTAEKTANIDVKDGGVRRPNFFASISSLQARNASMKLAQDSSENGNQHDCGLSKKTESCGSIVSNPTSNLAEAATSLPPPGLKQRMSEPMNVSSKEIKISEADVSVRGKQPSSTSTPKAENIGESVGHPNASPSKKMRTGKFSLNITNSNSVEAAILDLEELVNKVKWIKGILQFGLPNSPASWKFIEHRQSSMPN